MEHLNLEEQEYVFYEKSDDLYCYFDGERVDDLVLTNKHIIMVRRKRKDAITVKLPLDTVQRHDGIPQIVVEDGINHRWADESWDIVILFQNGVKRISFACEEVYEEDVKRRLKVIIEKIAVKISQLCLTGTLVLKPSVPHIPTTETAEDEPDLTSVDGNEDITVLDDEEGDEEDEEGDEEDEEEDEENEDEEDEDDDEVEDEEEDEEEDTLTPPKKGVGVAFFRRIAGRVKDAVGTITGGSPSASTPPPASNGEFKLCRSCGRTIKSSANFCPLCGAPQNKTS